ncbi:MAG TPA: PEFG-CTERM sorting domain-containing protein [Candidatus Nitrosotalea sp.]|nr:PEFG-CTERM sorting domain-containing protein [Candidatus Nitrosotalea sp.]
MRISLKGLLLFGVLISAAGISPAFAASGGFMAQPNSMDANSSMGMTNNTTPANLPPPAYLVTNASGNSGTVVSMNTATPGISVATDKASYNDGDKIMITGKTRDYLGDTPLTLIIRNPVGNVVSINQIPVGADKTFSSSLTAGGALWQAAGTYSVYVQFGGQERSATTTFQFSGSHVGAGNTIQVDGTNSSVTYTITNGKVLDIKADTNSKSLIVSIQTTGDGVLTVSMPRTLIDAKKTDGSDDQYFVLNDGQENDQFQETTTTNTDRTLQIPFSDGTSQIEIIGTFVVPEFGTIAAMILAIAVISIIAISAKTGLRFTPKV